MQAAQAASDAAAAAPTPAAAAPDLAALTRQQLADLGQQQVVELMRTGKLLIDAYAQLQPTPASQQQLAGVQVQYLRLASDIQATLQQCQVVQQREEQAAAAADAQLQQQQPPPGGQDGLAELQAQVAALRRQLADRNALVKQVVDRLRHMMDAFTMWESHRRHLVQHAVQYAAAGTGSIA